MMNYTPARRQRPNWAEEITRPPEAGMYRDEQQMMMPRPQNGEYLDMRNDQSDQVIEDPGSRQEEYMGSLKAMLRQNKGNYLVATFLVGTQNLVSWEGILYEVGNDYMTIYQEPRDRYIVCDIYSLKYMEFYDTRRRDACNRLLGTYGSPE